MASEKSINLLIVHPSEEEAERILSLLRNYQIAVRPTRCIDEESLLGILERKQIDMVLCQQIQQQLPTQTVIDHIKRMGQDLPVIALIDDFDIDQISDAIDAGANSYCSPKLPEHMRHVILRDMKNLHQRRENIRLTQELRQTEKRVNSLLDSSKQAIAYIHDGMHAYTNQSYQELFKYDDFEELEVTPFLNMIAKEDVAKAKKVLRDINKNILPDEQLSFEMITAQGDKFDGLIDVSKATLNGEQCAQFIINLPAVDPEVEKELFEIKNKDLLTKFYNRSYFHELLSDDIDQARSQPGDCLLMIGVDNEHELEKKLGIGNFDLFIANLAEYLESKFGDDTTYCRYSDALFILKVNTSIEKAEKAAEKISHLITEQIFDAGDTSTNCTVSIAVTQLTQQSQSVNNVIKTLTDLLENTLKKGGNQVAVFDPAEEEKQARAASQAWIDRITGGLENDRFVLHYQPVVNIDGDDSQSYECLVRLKSDDDQLIYPQQFIPVAIKYGFINDIDRRVLSKAIEAIKQADFDVTLFIKVSSESLSDSAFPAGSLNN